MTEIGLFAGIGGFQLAAKWMGWKTLAWCEWNEFGQKVLKHHFPEAEGFGDITKTDFTKYANRIDILTGGFPCQPYSTAGKRLGKDDDRHLWPEMLRAIREVQPSWVVGENVRGLTNWNGGLVFDEVQADLETQGYEVLPFLLPACAVNAPHRRDRIWFIAYSDSNANRNFRKQDRETNSIPGEYRTEICTGESIGTIARIIADTNSYEQGEIRRNNEEVCRFPAKECRSENGSVISGRNIKEYITTNSGNKGLQGGKINGGFRGIGQNGNEQFTGLLPSNWQEFPTESPLCSRDDGLSEQLDGITLSKHRNESIKAFGNAIVPQVAFEIFKSIAAYKH